MKNGELVIVSPLNHPDITCACRTTSRVTAECDGCGAVVTGGLHLPEVAFGWYCPACCPVCNGQHRLTSDEVQAMAVNRARLLGSRDAQARRVAAKPKPKVRRVANKATPKARRVCSTEARREAALRQWSDPKARARIVAGIRRGAKRDRQKASDRAKAQWTDAGARARLLAGMKKARVAGR